jgi:sugar-specific transcriptional regulator TrmB
MQQKELHLLLTTAGLAPKEAQVYLFLLEKGATKASKIFQALNMKKGNTYALLDKLIEQGIVIKKKTQFYPQPPLIVFSKLQEKAKLVKSSLDNFKNLLPELMSNYKLNIGKPTIRYFEGETGVMEIFEDIYAKKEGPVYGCVDLEKANQAMPSLITKKLIPQRIRNKLMAISLVADSPQAREVKQQDAQQYRQTTLIDKTAYPMPAEIDIYEDKIAMLTFTRGEFIGLLIENQDLATTMKSIMKLANKNKSSS